MGVKSLKMLANSCEEAVVCKLKKNLLGFMITIMFLFLLKIKYLIVQLLPILRILIPNLSHYTNIS